MKAIIPRTLLGFIVALLVILIVAISLQSLPEAFAKGAAEELLKFTVYRTYSFDINDFLVNPADPKTFDSNKQNDFFGIGTGNPDPAFCINLRNCIEMNIKGGKQCLITYKVKPGTKFDPNDILETIKNRCPQVDIKEELYSKTGRKVCKFNPSSLQAKNFLREDNISLIDYEPEIHNCYLPDNLGTHNVLNDVDSFNYLYSGRGTADGYDFVNGGTVRIVVTNVSINNDPYATCSYSLYACGQNAIANNTDETPVSVFRKIQNLDQRELYYNETIVWGGPSGKYEIDVSRWTYCLMIAVPLLGPIAGPAFCLALFGGSIPSFPVEYNVYGYYPHPYEFTFHGECQSRGTCDKALIDAVDAGMWEWNKANYDDKSKMKYFIDYASSDITNVYFSYSPITDISIDPNIKFDTGCWDTNYENSNVYQRTELKLGNNVFTDSTSLYHIFNFGNGFNTNNKVSMTLGIKKIFITAKTLTYDYGWPIGERTTSTLERVNNNFIPPRDLKSRVILVLDPITFCSE